MSKATHLPAVDVLAGDLIIRHDGTAYRVRDATPSASGKVIRFSTLVEVAAPGGPELGRRFNLSHRAGTTLLVERGPEDFKLLEQLDMLRDVADFRDAKAVDDGEHVGLDELFSELDV
ncbi:hypothetical protein [Microterricola viridarii]|uniref:Uncharacterized protein n=1 Tax=Microterricola viridarii TaxID=412690 RepID=A0A1H1T4B4_9MICO|nr:hypothetical protein [Microterricola viridarii]SDS55020.1 hypothetical protein SAMN04489834_1686 [Microterricola viridarii]